VSGVEACLALAATWHAWDGQPVAGTVDGKANTCVTLDADWSGRRVRRPDTRRLVTTSDCLTSSGRRDLYHRK
jgi:hypothetical protein